MCSRPVLVDDADACKYLVSVRDSKDRCLALVLRLMFKKSRKKAIDFDFVIYEDTDSVRLTFTDLDVRNRTKTVRYPFPSLLTLTQTLITLGATLRFATGATPTDYTQNKRYIEIVVRYANTPLGGIMYWDEMTIVSGIPAREFKLPS